MTQQGSIALYADRVQVSLPRTDWPGVLEAAQAQKAGYVVVEEGALRRIRPQLAFLLESTPPELALVYSFEGGRTRVYQFVEPP
jgi:hypothetical protein